MSTLELFDLAVTGAGGSSRESAVHLAERFVTSLVAEVNCLWDLYFSFSPDKQPQAEAELRERFEDWAIRAAAVIERVKQWGNRVNGVQELQHQHGRVGAMLNISPQAYARGFEQIRQGRTRSREEVIRELRVGSQR